MLEHGVMGGGEGTEQPSLWGPHWYGPSWTSALPYRASEAAFQITKLILGRPSTLGDDAWLHGDEHPLFSSMATFAITCPLLPSCPGSSLRILASQTHLVVCPQASACRMNAYLPLSLLVGFLLGLWDPMLSLSSAATLPWTCFHEGAYTRWSSQVPVAPPLGWGCLESRHWLLFRAVTDLELLADQSEAPENVWRVEDWCVLPQTLSWTQQIPP